MCQRISHLSWCPHWPLWVCRAHALHRQIMRLCACAHLTMCTYCNCVSDGLAMRHRNCLCRRGWPSVAHLQLPWICVEYIFGNIETCDEQSPCYYPCLDYLCDFTVVFRLNMDDSLYYLTYHIPEDIWPTCRVWSENWQVRGLCRCLWYARRGLCLCPCVTTPRGFTSLPTGGEV